jgi:hypothetical protein
MRTFIGGTTPHWPEGTRVPHVYALPDPDRPDNDDFFDLARRHRTILTGRFAHLVTPVSEPWLHATVHMVSEPTGPSPAPEVLRDLAAALHHHLADQSEFTVWAAPHVGSSGPGLDLSPDEDFDQLRVATAVALDEVLGQERASYRPNAPHVTTGYCHTAGGSGPVASALRTSRPSRAPLLISQVGLVMVTQDAAHHTYQWEPPLAVIDLKASS